MVYKKWQCYWAQSLMMGREKLMLCMPRDWIYFKEGTLQTKQTGWSLGATGQDVMYKLSCPMWMQNPTIEQVNCDNI